MSRKEKLKQSLLRSPSNFKWDDLVTVMKYCGFEMYKAKGGGSSRKFYNPSTGQVAQWHEPHPGNEVLKYVVKEAVELIREQNDETTTTKI